MSPSLTAPTMSKALTGWHASVAGFLLSLVYVLVIIVYRLTLHPLAHIPGPFLARITGWYSAYHAGRGSRHLDQLRCHDLYGPIVRWGPNYVSFNTSTAVQTIYGNSRKNNVRKADMYNFFDDPGQSPSTFNTLEKGPQSRKRRILMHAFSPQALEGADEIIVRNTDRWCDLLSRGDSSTRHGWTEARDMTQYCDWFAFDTAVDLAFGKTFDLLGNEEYRFLPSYIMSCLRLLTFIGHSPLLPYWSFMKRMGIHRWLASGEYSRRDRFISFVRSAIAEREDAEKSSLRRRDYFYWLTHAVDSVTKQHYSLGEVEMECVLLWNAGTNGPSAALAGSFFYLSCYPRVLECLTVEVRSTFDNAEDIRSGSKMASCTYLQAVLDEVIRLCPANTGVLPRQAMAGGQVVDGHFLPENTVLGVSAYAIHHNPEYFPDPFSFRPERWIVDSEPDFDAERVSKARAAFFSFSAGGSGCVGRPLAYQELAIALARVLYRFDIRRTPGNRLGEGRSSGREGRRNPNEFQLDDVHAVLTVGPSIQFRKKS